MWLDEKGFVPAVTLQINVRLFRVKSQLCGFPAVQSGDSYLTLLCFKVPISTWGHYRPTSWGSCEGQGVVKAQDSAWIWEVPSKH